MLSVGSPGGRSGQGVEEKRARGACSMTTGLNSTEAGCFRLLLRDPDAGRHTHGAQIHVHIEDSKSLPSLAHPQAWQRWECALCRLMWTEAKKLLPSVSSSRGRDLKSKQTPQHQGPPRRPQVAQHLSMNRNTETQGQSGGGTGTGACRLVIAYLPPGS